MISNDCVSPSLDSVYVTMIRKNDLPEVEQMFHNIVPLLDAIIGNDGYF